MEEAMGNLMETDVGIGGCEGGPDEGIEEAEEEFIMGPPAEVLALAGTGRLKEGISWATLMISELELLPFGSSG
jgi:hypothetical protein